MCTVTEAESREDDRQLYSPASAILLSLMTSILTSTFVSIFFVMMMPFLVSEWMGFESPLYHSMSRGGSGFPVALQISWIVPPRSTYSVPDTRISVRSQTAMPWDVADYLCSAFSGINQMFGNGSSTACVDPFKTRVSCTCDYTVYMQCYAYIHTKSAIETDLMHALCRCIGLFVQFICIGLYIRIHV